MRSMLRGVFVVVFAFFQVCLLGSLAGASSSYTVTRVVDGDTIVVNGGLTVRLIGVDTPETVKPRTPVQCGGPEASAYSKSRLVGRRVRLSFDRVSGRYDKYGRTLAYVWVGGELFNRSLIEQGFGYQYDFASQRYRYLSSFVEAEMAARRAHRGVWGHCVR